MPNFYSGDGDRRKAEAQRKEQERVARERADRQRQEQQERQRKQKQQQQSAAIAPLERRAQQMESQLKGQLQRVIRDFKKATNLEFPIVEYTIGWAYPNPNDRFVLYLWCDWNRWQKLSQRERSELIHLLGRTAKVSSTIYEDNEPNTSRGGGTKVYRQCRECNGTGSQYGRECYTCSSKGMVDVVTQYSRDQDMRQRIQESEAQKRNEEWLNSPYGGKAGGR